MVKGGRRGDVGEVEGGDESGEEKVGSGEIWTIVKRVLQQLTIVKRVRVNKIFNGIKTELNVEELLPIGC